MGRDPSRKGDCWDNAVVESFFSTLNTELVHRMAFLDRESAHHAGLDYVDAFCNPKRRHSTLGYLSPVSFEQQLSMERAAA